MDAESAVDRGVMERTRSPYRDKKVLMSRQYDLDDKDILMLPIAGGLFRAVQSSSLGRCEALQRENGYLRAKMEGDRAYAEQRFEEYRQQEGLQRDIDKGILSRIMCEAQERYQHLQG